MNTKTNIEWVKNPDGSQGYTWNPITGCLNHDNGLCKGGGFPCYAYKLANGRLKGAYLVNRDRAGRDRVVTDLMLADPFYPRFWAERLGDLPIATGILEIDGAKSRRGIFVCAMGDLFGAGVPEEWTAKVLDRIKRSSMFHRFYLLTKQPGNLIKWSPFPENCYVGVTVTNADMYLPAMEALDDIDAKVKYVSFEPLLENPSEFCEQWSEDLGATLDWLIIGACTGTLTQMKELFWTTDSDEVSVMPYGKKWTLQPKIEWVQEIVAAADKAGIPVFLKDNLAPLIKWPDAGEWAFKPLSNRLRQEMPKGVK